ncbi:MAG: MBL fold metallo-hydrolase [Nitrososphaerota archaeon]|nr:MBL fold metallo-hydrolase [Aigarchaeota archaeon]MDW8077032.1 MBL fold metallo-hydrolase [Nitrososphaerota archaeon]
MRASYESGALIACKDTMLAFDAAGDYSDISLRCITHAHVDHTTKVNEPNTLMSPETYELLKALGRLKKSARTLEFEKATQVRSVRLAAVNAGHILGSCQYVIECDGKAILFSGDVNVYDTLVTRAAKPVNVDTMILEATYGDPNFVFPDREVIYSNIVKWICGCLKGGSVPAFRTYLVGKSQEIIRLVNKYLGIPVVVNDAVARACEVYNKFGLGLSYLRKSTTAGKEALRTGECVYVSNYRTNVPTGRRMRWAIATGWALRYRFEYYDAAFPLSSHADFRGLVSHVEACAPKKVYTMHGYSKRLAKELERRGFAATNLESVGALVPLSYYEEKKT